MSSKMKNLILLLLPVVGVLFATAVFAQGGGDLVSMSQSITKQATAITTLMKVAAYVAGVGFALAGVLQFKAHKENPQQTPLSKPVVMIVVSACLLFLPTIMDVAGKSLFGESGKKAMKDDAEGG